MKKMVVTKALLVKGGKNYDDELLNDLLNEDAVEVWEDFCFDPMKVVAFWNEEGDKLILELDSGLIIQVKTAFRDIVKLYETV
jgi:hypothetical protein